MTEPTERALALASEALPAHEYLRPAVARVIQGVIEEKQREGNLLRTGFNNALNQRDKAWAENEALKADNARLLLAKLPSSDDYNAMIAERDALQREVEHERQRLAAVGVLAHSRNEAQLAGMRPEYESDALAGVRLLLRNLLDAIEETP